MPTSAEHIAARDDTDLQRRLIAVAEQAGVPDASRTVMENLGRLVSHEVTVNGGATSVTAVHAYAAGVRKEHLAAPQALPPGLNPSAVTDPLLTAVISAVLGTETP